MLVLFFSFFTFAPMWTYARTYVEPNAVRSVGTWYIKIYIYQPDENQPPQQQPLFSAAFSDMARHGSNEIRTQTCARHGFAYIRIATKMLKQKNCKSRRVSLCPSAHQRGVVGTHYTLHITTTRQRNATKDTQPTIEDRTESKAENRKRKSTKKTD